MLKFWLINCFILYTYTYIYHPNCFDRICPLNHQYINIHIAGHLQHIWAFPVATIKEQEDTYRWMYKQERKFLENGINVRI